MVEEAAESMGATPPYSTCSSNSEGDDEPYRGGAKHDTTTNTLGQVCECGYLRTAALIRYDCTTSKMFKERTSFLLATALMGGMFAIHRAYLAVEYSDFNFTIALLLYVPLLNSAILRRGTTATGSPTGNRRPLRLLFLVTAICSLAGPTALLVLYPALSVTGIARHLWLVLAQLLLESASFSISQQNEVSVLVRILSTSACIMYRLPVARSWWASTNDRSLLQRFAELRVPVAATTLCRALAGANFVYWAACLFWYIIPIALRANDPSLVQSQLTRQPRSPPAPANIINRKRTASR